MKKNIIYILFLLISLPIYPKTKYIKYKFDKSRVVYGDSLLLSWEAPKRYNVTISGIDSVFGHVGKIYIQSKEKERITLTAIKGNNTLVRHTRFVKIMYPQLNYFTAVRDEANPSRVNIEWNTENYKKVSIDGIGNNLPAKGRATIIDTEKTELSIEVENYIGERLVKKVRVPKDYSQGRGYLKGVTRLNRADSIPFYMDIISVNVSNYPDEIEMKVVVYDTLGNYITGLAPPESSPGETNEIFRKVFVKSDFGKKPVNFKVREIKEEMRSNTDISFVLDHSGSMNEVLDNFKDIAAYFAAGKNPDDRMSVVVFDHRIYRLSDLTTSNEELERSIKKNQYILGGSTALYAACDEGLETMRFSERDKALVVFTDGRENSSFPYYGFRATNANHLSNRVRKMKARLYVIGYGKSVNYETLDELCRLSNGKFYYINNLEDLKNALFEIDFLLKSYYSVTFAPPQTTGPADIKFIYRNFDSDMVIEDDYFIGYVQQIDEIKSNDKAGGDSVDVVFPTQVIANFDYNKALIEDQYESPLQKYARYLLEHPGVQVSVADHSDSKGNENIRQKISQKRADAVADYFIKQGVSPARIKKEYYSFSRPVHLSEDYEWQARENRRVEIIMYKQN